MDVREINNHLMWNSFLDDIGYLSFLQDFEYGEVERSLGREVIRVGFFENNHLVGVAQLIGYQGKRGKGLVIHHGPVVQEGFLKEVLEKLLDFLKKRKLTKKYDFLRINPALPENEAIEEIFKKLGFKLAPTYAVSENFWLKEIKSDEEMLKEMKDGHRKEILQALKKPYLEVEKTTNPEALEIFWNLYKDLFQRKKFNPYPKEFISKEFEIFANQNKALMFLGKVEGKYYSASLIIFSHAIAFYHHSASLPLKEPLNYKIQWEVMKEAQKRGCKFYNFWGIARREDPDHPWYGLTKFKQGFGGKLIKFVPTFDYPFSVRYFLISLYEKIKRKKL